MRILIPPALFLPGRGGRFGRAVPHTATGGRAFGQPGNTEDYIETFKDQGLAQAGLLVHLLRAGKVLSAAAAALEVLTEEAMEGVMAVAAVAKATGKLKEKVSEEESMWAFFFCPSFFSSNPDFHKLS
jgi:hypothetical protein